MSSLLKLDAVVKVLESAFRPLECTVSVSSDKQRVTFAIFEPNGTQILTAASRDELEMRDGYSLRLTIDRVRSHLRAEGFRIEPWVPPT